MEERGDDMRRNYGLSERGADLSAVRRTVGRNVLSGIGARNVRHDLAGDHVLPCHNGFVLRTWVC